MDYALKGWAIDDEGEVQLLYDWSLLDQTLSEKKLDIIVDMYRNERYTPVFYNFEQDGPPMFARSAASKWDTSRPPISVADIMTCTVRDYVEVDFCNWSAYYWFKNNCDSSDYDNSDDNDDHGDNDDDNDDDDDDDDNGDKDDDDDDDNNGDDDNDDDNNDNGDDNDDDNDDNDDDDDNNDDDDDDNDNDDDDADDDDDEDDDNGDDDDDDDNDDAIDNNNNGAKDNKTNNINDVIPALSQGSDVSEAEVDYSFCDDGYTSDWGREVVD